MRFVDSHTRVELADGQRRFECPASEFANYAPDYAAVAAPYTARYWDECTQYISDGKTQSADELYTPERLQAYCDQIETWQAQYREDHSGLSLDAAGLLLGFTGAAETPEMAALKAVSGGILLHESDAPLWVQDAAAPTHTAKGVGFRLRTQTELEADPRYLPWLDDQAKTQASQQAVQDFDTLPTWLTSWDMAQVETYIDAHVTDLTGAKTVLKELGKAVILIRDYLKMRQ